MEDFDLSEALQAAGFKAVGGSDDIQMFVGDRDTSLDLNSIGYFTDTGHEWPSRDGPIDIGRMEDEHLVSALEMLEARRKKVAALLDSPASRDSKWIERFKTEADRRKKARGYAKMSLLEIRKLPEERELLYALLIRNSMPPEEVNHCDHAPTEGAPADGGLRGPSDPPITPGSDLPF